jgi:anaerobic carbon-monoxide dehydrogenase catalytic subunit
MNADLIVARTFARAIASGATAHSDYASDSVEALRRFGAGDPESGYQIANIDKLRALAVEWQIPVENRRIQEIARDMAAAMKSQFGLREGQMIPLLRAPQELRDRWARTGITPRGFEHEIAELLRRTSQSVESDPVAILHAAMRTALADGWGASMIATDVQDLLFGLPQAIRSQTNLEVLKQDAVNILMHGHEPGFCKLIMAASRDDSLVAEARQAGAREINIADACCTANEILTPRGVPAATNYRDLELALLTGAVDLMVLDFPCVMPSLPQVAGCRHTRVVTTSSKTHIPGAERIIPDSSDPKAAAREIIRRAIEGYSRRDPARVHIPRESVDFVAGFTNENLPRYLGGRLRAGYQPLIEALAAGRIRGVVAVIGCITPLIVQDAHHLELVRNLLSQDVLVVQTGSSALASAQAGLLNPETALKSAGPGLREVCEAVGIPPVLHLGSGVDNSRWLSICATLISEAGICQEFSELPIAVAVPEAVDEEIITTGLCAIASGIYTVLMPEPDVAGSHILRQYLEGDVERDTGGRFSFAADIGEAARGILGRLDLKRKELKLAPMLYENGVKSDGITPRAFTDYEPPIGVQALGCGKSQERSQARPPEA